MRKTQTLTVLAIVALLMVTATQTFAQSLVELIQVEDDRTVIVGVTESGELYQFARNTLDEDDSNPSGDLVAPGRVIEADCNGNGIEDKDELLPPDCASSTLTTESRNDG